MAALKVGAGAERVSCGNRRKREEIGRVGEGESHLITEDNGTGGPVDDNANRVSGEGDNLVDGEHDFR